MPNLVRRNDLGGMAAPSFDPFDPFRLLDQVERALSPVWTWTPPSTAAAWPAFDVDHTDDAVVITADVPGLTEDELAIHVAGRTLTIEGATTRRRYRGSFQRRFTLAEGLDADGIEAELKHGVLTVYVPKTAQAKPRKIKLGTGVLDKVRGLLGGGRDKETSAS